MSTKSSLAHGPGFHLYREVFDDNNVYLEVEGTHFKAYYNRVMLPIPVPVWEVIRCCQGADYEYVEQVAKGIAHFTQIRVHQQQIRRAVDELELLQGRSESAGESPYVNLTGSRD